MEFYKIWIQRKGRTGTSICVAFVILIDFNRNSMGTHESSQEIEAEITV